MRRDKMKVKWQLVGLATVLYIVGVYTVMYIVFHALDSHGGRLADAPMPLSTDPDSMTVLQYNLQQRFLPEGRIHQFFGAHSERSFISTELMPPIIAPYNADIVCLNELFTRSLRRPLIRNMERNGYPHHTKILNQNIAGEFIGDFWSGGVIIFSRFPITKEIRMQYDASASIDTLAAKGVVYARVSRLGRAVHVFATHTNASYVEEGRALDEGQVARRRQLAELRSFVSSLSIPPSELTLYCGDFNIDKLSELGQPGDQYTEMLTALNATDPPLHPQSWAYTADSLSNAYMESPAEQRIVDYVLLGPGEHTAVNNIMNLKIPPGHKLSTLDVSDHYPVLSTIQFSPTQTK